MCDTIEETIELLKFHFLKIKENDNYKEEIIKEREMQIKSLQKQLAEIKENWEGQFSGDK